MTRVNTIPVYSLCDKHLLAEHREIKRIPNVILKGKYSLSDAPNRYTLGTGHVKFFYDKLLWLHGRYVALYKECVRRGFDVTNYEGAFLECKKEYPYLYNNWYPTFMDHLWNGFRIVQKLDTMKNPKWTEYKND